MFNSLIRDFDEDPFFSDPFRAHRDHMRQMMRSFSEPFGGHDRLRLMDVRSHGHSVGEQLSSLEQRDAHRDMMWNPFTMADNMMNDMRRRMEEKHRSFENISTEPNCHSFSSSSVMTYSKVGDDTPKVFHATSSTRHAPGGIKEIRRAVKDSESGLEKMSIGHHIQDRGHIMEKKYNKKTGEREFNQDFQNMDESEALAFDEEWKHKVSKFHPSVSVPHLEERKPRAVHRAALTSPDEPTHRGKPKRSDGEKVIKFKTPDVKESGVKK
ncbi:myeloid leukemia factor 1 [Thalassophryne amazonica]|uniref:myeloid leukemia factor 1 n=1 Tax=Thalassophryne amazonica TaxID=390379 RepID=UPI0014716655|nr:myeloid leukemia factor 1 [Thalassophryne amazonica]